MRHKSSQKEMPYLVVAKFDGGPEVVIFRSDSHSTMQSTASTLNGLVASHDVPGVVRVLSAMKSNTPELLLKVVTEMERINKQ